MYFQSGSYLRQLLLNIFWIFSTIKSDICTVITVQSTVITVQSNNLKYQRACAAWHHSMLVLCATDLILAFCDSKNYSFFSSF